VLDEALNLTGAPALIGLRSASALIGRLAERRHRTNQVIGTLGGIGEAQFQAPPFGGRCTALTGGHPRSSPP
jgi:hypothetical protein